MPRLFIIPLVLLFVHTVHAQSHTAILGGYTYSTARILVNDVKQKSGYRNGFTASILFDIPFEGILHFTPSLGYHLSGYQANYDSGNVKHTENNIHFVSLEPALSLHFPCGDKNTIILSLSPVFSFPFSGKEKSTYRNDSISNNRLKFAYGDYGLFDLGLSGSVGYKIKKILIKAGWFQGLTNLDTNEANMRNIQDRIFSFSIGYFIK